MRLLLEDVNPSKIVCLTYTNAGANEMHERINHELSNWVIFDDEKIIKKLNDLSINPNEKNIYKARTLFAKILDGENKISIQTIHSFCQNILKSFSIEANVPLNFELIEGNKSLFLLEIARKELFKNAQNDIELQKNIAEIFYRITEDSLAVLINNLITKKDKLDDLQNIFGNLKNSLPYLKKIINLDDNELNAKDIICEFYKKLDINELEIFCQDLEKTGSRNQEFQNKIKIFLQNPCEENFIFFKNAFITDNNSNRKIYGSINKNKMCDIYQNLCDKNIILINNCFEKLFSLEVYNCNCNLLIFIDNFLQIYKKLKLNNSYLDYHDLIVKTFNLLNNPEYKDWVKLKLDGFFDHILIDESQDTNILQFQIIIALCEDFFTGFSKAENKRSIFIVGDEKQSIFSFQGSQCDISSKIYQFFSNKLQDKLLKIDLNNSFRSTKKILEFVDKIFCQEQFGKAICKTESYLEHNPIRLGDSHIEFWQNISSREIDPINLEKIHKYFNFDNKFLADIDELNDEENSLDQKNHYHDAFILAEIIAKKIHFWVTNKRIISSKNRPVNYRDIMILIRNKVNKFSDYLAYALNKYQIPFTSVLKIKFSENLIIQDLLSLARFVCLKEDDFNLIHLLKSPFFNLNEEDIFQICQIKNLEKISVFNSIKDPNIISTLNIFLDLAKNNNAYQFYYLILNNQNYRDNFILRFDSSAIEIIDKFLLNIANLSTDKNFDLQLMLEIIEKIDPEIKLNSSLDNAVKISTIHSAKGLQSPIIIIPEGLNNSVSKNNIFWHEENNISFPLWIPNLSKNYHKLFYEILDKQKHQDYEENLRLLYVALTRAEDEIYLTSYGTNINNKNWYSIFLNLVNEEFQQVKQDELINFLVNCDIDSANQNDMISKKTSLPKSTLKDLQKNNSQIDFFNKFLPKIDHDSIENNIQNISKIKGILIHKILEVIGRNYKKPISVINSYCLRLIENTSFLDLKSKKEITNMINDFLTSSHYHQIFSGEIKCEAEVNYLNYFARIDLVIFKEDEIIIIDYKSDKTIPEFIPTPYQEQLKKYFFIIQNLYRNKKIRCAILWINDLKLQFCNLD